MIAFIATILALILSLALGAPAPAQTCAALRVRNADGNWEGRPEWMIYKQRVVEWILRAGR